MSGKPKLMTLSLEKALQRRPIGSTEEYGPRARIVTKYFNPCGAGTWLVTEGEKQKNGDWLFFGYVHIQEWEAGYFMLSELENVELPYGMGIERDVFAKGTVLELMGDV